MAESASSSNGSETRVANVGIARAKISRSNVLRVDGWLGPFGTANNYQRTNSYGSAGHGVPRRWQPAASGYPQEFSPMWMNNTSVIPHFLVGIGFFRPAVERLRRYAYGWPGLHPLGCVCVIVRRDDREIG